MTSHKYKDHKVRWRLVFLQITLSLFGLLLIAQLFKIQIVSSAHYSTLAASQHKFLSVLTPERGQILIKNSSSGDSFYPVAVNKNNENLAISPYHITDPEAAVFLSDVSGVSPGEVSAFLSQKDRKYIILKKDLNEIQVNLVKERQMKGVWLETETVRHYPENNYLSHVLGFIGYTNEGNKRGVYGLESQFEELLAGRPGHFEGAADPSGDSIMGARKLVPAEHGSNVVLTIDRAIQSFVEETLSKYMTRFSADSGTVIVADPRTGAILAMASQPSFDPNRYNEVKDIKIYVNPAVQKRYEPGSIIKPLTVAAALEEGVIEPDETYEDTGSVVVSGHTIRNSDNEAHGVQTMTQVLEQSLNTGMVYIQRKLGGPTLSKYFKDFRLDQKTDLNLPGEVAGNLANLKSRSEIDHATAAFGQGISATPIGLIQAYTALANQGEMMKPFLISELHHSDGSKELVQPQSAGRVLSSETTAQVSHMLINVVENGHGKRAAVPGYYIAGKTGTAQVPLENERGYDPDKTIGSFIGFGPAENPAFVMLVKIENPKGVKFAESTAAPAFGEIAKFILDYLQIPPVRTEGS